MAGNIVEVELNNSNATQTLDETTNVVPTIGDSAEHTHFMKQIVGLVDTFNVMNKPHEIYSNNGGYAEFREWTSDPNSYYVRNIKDNGTGELGYFVGLACDETDGNIYIDVCQSGQVDVYGVVTNNSGLCGYQHEDYNELDDTSRDKSDSNEPYAKVCLLGDVMVRVYDDTNYNNIAIGDYVVPDNYGCAVKSESGVGFKVISRGIAGVGTTEYEWYYVVIALVPQNDNVNRVMAELSNVRGSIGNIVNQFGKIEEDLSNASNISSIIDGFRDELGEQKQGIENSLSVSQNVLNEIDRISDETAEAIGNINNQYNDALTAIDEAKTNIGNAMSEIYDIRENMDPLAEHKDKIVGFFTNAGDEEATLATLVQNTTDIATMQQKVDDSGASVKFLVTHADMYSVGKHSLTYGLSYEEAQGVLGNGGFIYVPTETHIEESYIYNCVLTTNVPENTNVYFSFGGVNYSFMVQSGLTGENIVKYDTRMKKLTVNDYKFDFVEVDDVGTYFIELAPEKRTGFIEYAAYQWSANDDKDGYWWKKIDTKVSYSDKEPTNEDGALSLWYCANGVLTNNYQYERTPGTLYRWNGSQWIAAATVNDSNARSTSLFNQTAEYITSTITDVNGNLSNIRQEVDSIESTVSKADGKLSQIELTAEQIRAGTYKGADNASQLEILLNEVNSATVATSHVLVGSFLGSAPEAYGNKYGQKPYWDGKKFVFGSDAVADGAYYFIDEAHEQYCEVIDGGYNIYEIGNQTMASLSQQVTENTAAINNFTNFNSSLKDTYTSLFQESDENGAKIGSMVMGQYRERTYITLDITDEEKILIKKRYSTPPTWSLDENGVYCWAYENGSVADENGIYCVPIDNTDDEDDRPYYYKLVLDVDNNIIGYEKYKMLSSSYASIVGEVDENGSVIGLVAGNNDVEGGVFVEAINKNTSVLVKADKIGVNGIAVFKSGLTDGSTTINGDYITTGVIKSNNYAGPITYVMYGAALDTVNNVIKMGTQFSECIYYTPVINGTLSPSSKTYYYCDAIEVGAQLFTEQGECQYVVCENSFDFIPSNIETVGTKFDLNEGTIFSRNLELDRAGNLSITGKITATSGWIGDNTGNGFAINYRGEDADKLYYLSNNQNGYSGSTVDNGTKGVYIGPDGIGLGNGNFYVDHFGNVTMNGSIKLNGSITWNANSSPTLVLYGKDDYTVGTPDYTSAPPNSDTGWHKTCGDSDLYAIYSYDGGNTWTQSPIRFRGEKGDSGADMSDIDLFNILTCNGSELGIFPFDANDDGDKLFINASYIQTGTLAADRIDTENLSCTKLYSKGYAGYYYAKIQSGIGDFGIYSQYAEDSAVPNDSNCIWGVYHSDPGTDVVNFYSYGNNYMGYNDTQKKLYPKGAWDFSSCTTEGLGVVPVFG